MDSCDGSLFLLWPWPQVMLVIDAAVSHLDDLHSLEDFLLNLGKKHQAVGVRTQSFAVGPTSYRTTLPKQFHERMSREHFLLLFFFFLCVLQAVGESLLYMLQCSLGPAYTAPLRQAWLNMYSIVVAMMSRGYAENGEDKAD